MTKTFEEITSPVKRVRVLDSTRFPDEETRVLIGGTFEVRGEFYDDNTIAVWNADKSDWYWFNRSDVQFLTPLTFKGVDIGIDDEVEAYGTWHTVYGYQWFDGEWLVAGVEDNDFEGGCGWVRNEAITAHRPLHTPQVKMTDEELVEEMRKRGLLRDGQVLK